MARAPFQVLVLPWRATADGSLEYAVFRRSDGACWQGIAGGGEGDETPLAAARREASEECGIPPDAAYLPLDAIASIPATVFRDAQHWGDDVFVVTEHAFGVDATGRRLTLSHEHLEHRWLPCAEARALLTFDSNRTALWELNQRLRGLGPRG